MAVTISIVQDTRRAKNGNKYPLKLRVTFDRLSQYYNTIYDLTVSDYQKFSASRLSTELVIVRDKLKELQRQAEIAIKDLNEFNFSDFERKFVRYNPLFRQKKFKFQIVSNGDGEFDYSAFHKKFPILLEDCNNALSLTCNYKAYIQKLLREDRISSAVCYQCSYVSIKKFKGNVALTLITPSFLNEYETSCKRNNISKSTIGIYLRPLRAIFNEALEQGIISKQKDYPFGRRKYQIPTSRNVKKALDLKDIEKIYLHLAISPDEQRAKDFWLFSYFGNGMNPKDIADLKFKNLHEDYLVFERSKTERTQRNDPKLITAYITEDMRKIIQRWGNSDIGPENFVFPILVPGLSALRKYQLLQNFVGIINDHMKKILLKLGINKKATTYVARHSFSTILKRSGVSTEFIQEALGHSSMKTTENYLDSFEKDVKKEFAQRLVSFKDAGVKETSTI